MPKYIDKVAESFPQRREGKLNIYFHVSENSGVGYYRQFQPAMALREQGVANVMINDFKWGIGDQIEPASTLLFDIANWADVIVTGRRDVPQFYAQWGAVRDFFKVPVIVDTDDNVYHVRPSNPGYEGYHPGAEALIWNKYGKAKVFDAVTVSTEELKEFHKKDNPHIYVMPNQIDFKWFDQYPTIKKDDGFIRIGFIASAAHADGVKIIRKSIENILIKYPNVKFVITDMYRSMFAHLPKEILERFESVPWIKLEEWPKGLKSLGLDIGLAPLTDNLFNRGKSNLRWMEFSACGIPTIVSPVKPYLCVKNNEDAIIARESEDWFNAIEKLVLDKELRVRIGQNALNRIHKEFDIDKNIANWENVYREVHDKYHDFFGKKKIFEKVGKEKYKEIK